MLTVSARQAYARCLRAFALCLPYSCPPPPLAGSAEPHMPARVLSGERLPERLQYHCSLPSTGPGWLPRQERYRAGSGR